MVRISLGDAMKTGEIMTVREACGPLDEGLRPMTYALPSPDVGLTAALEGMADDMKAALRLCGDFTEAPPSTADVKEFTGLMDRAQEQFGIASRILKDARGS